MFIAKTNWQTSPRGEPNLRVYIGSNVYHWSSRFQKKMLNNMLAHHKKESQKSFSPNRLNMAQRDRSSLRSSVVYKQAAETEERLRAACVCGQPALPACYCTSLFKSEQSDDEGSWQTITFMFLSDHHYFCRIRLAPPQTAGVRVWNQGLVVTLRSGRGLMTLSPSGRDWG